MANSLYAWAVGHDVALLSLTNIESEVKAHNTAQPALQSVTQFIFSPPIDPFPNRDKTLDGRLYSQGPVAHYFEVTETEAAFQFQLTTYLSGGAAIDAPITFYGRRKGRTSTAAWKRYNCYLVYPESDGESGDLQYLGNGIVFVRWVLHDLTEAS